MKSYLNQYSDTLKAALDTIDEKQFDGFLQRLRTVYKNNRQVFIMGNGGSAATANHFVCDFGKNAVQDPAKRRFRILSLSDNVEKITAFANDVAYEEVFTQQLINLLQPDDLVVAISASGNSPNIVHACRYAQERGNEVVGLSGFEGGQLKELADVSLNAPLDSYEQVEDMHLILLHMVVCYMKDHPAFLNG